MTTRRSATGIDLEKLKSDPGTEVFHKKCDQRVFYDPVTDYFDCTNNHGVHNAKSPCPRWKGYICDEHQWNQRVLITGQPTLGWKAYLAEYFYVNAPDLEMVWKLYFDEKLGCTMSREMTPEELQEYYHRVSPWSTAGRRL